MSNFISKIKFSKKYFWSIVATATVLTSAVGVSLHDMLDEKSLRKEMATAARNYVESNHIAIADNMDASADMLIQNGYLSSTIDCADNSYVAIRNNGGEYTYDPILVCRNEGFAVDSKKASLFNARAVEIPSLLDIQPEIQDEEIEAVVTASNPSIFEIIGGAPQYSVDASIKTSGSVFVTISFSHPLIESSIPAGWTPSSSLKTLYRTYDANVDESFYVYALDTSDNTTRLRKKVTV